VTPKKRFDIYRGNDIQKAIFGLILSRVLKRTIPSMRAAKCFSIIVDCAPNMSQKEQLPVLLRCVDIYPKKR
jgi:hypothetical protein